MGMPQIMGFNYQGIGYESVKKMFDSFSRNEKNQIIGLFDFINCANSKMTQALRRKDFLTFARLYNGPAKAAVYADRIKKYCQEFKELTQKNVDKDVSQRILA
ncbi:MAG: N-acetylmuramidase domain-containing protein, partial [Candidatus Zixiibacteriota bacterium]